MSFQVFMKFISRPANVMTWFDSNGAWICLDIGCDLDNDSISGRTSSLILKLSASLNVEVDAWGLTESPTSGIPVGLSSLTNLVSWVQLSVVVSLYLAPVC